MDENLRHVLSNNHRHHLPIDTRSGFQLFRSVVVALLMIQTVATTMTKEHVRKCCILPFFNILFVLGGVSISFSWIYLSRSVSQHSSTVDGSRSSAVHEAVDEEEVTPDESITRL